MDGYTVKQKFASDSKTMTSLGTKANLKNTKHCVLITVLLCHLYLKFQLNKHNQFNHTSKMVKSIYLLFCEKVHTTQSQVN